MENKKAEPRAGWGGSFLPAHGNLSVFRGPGLAFEYLGVGVASLRLCTAELFCDAGQDCFRPRPGPFELIVDPRKPFSEADEHPGSPWRNARQDVETDEQEYDALKYRQDNSKYTENDESPPYNVDRDAFES